MCFIFSGANTALHSARTAVERSRTKNVAPQPAQRIKTVLVCLLLSLLGQPVGVSPAAQSQAQQSPAAIEALSVVVMDPLARPLSCDCVKGFAQRDYEKLARWLQQRLDCQVRLSFSEHLGRALRGPAGGKAHVVIGKRSVVEFDAAAERLKLRPLAMLTGKDGTTTLTGLFVVPSNASARTMKDLKGYRIIFGPPEVEERHGAAIAALKAAGLSVPQTVETEESCASAAFSAIESPKPAAAVISGYSKALLEGCGTIEKGALRVVGQTAPVPFITVFVDESVPPQRRQQILDALLSVREDAKLLEALESERGFVAVAKAEGTGAVGPSEMLLAGSAVQSLFDSELGEHSHSAIETLVVGSAAEGAENGGVGEAVGWPGWRGPARDALCRHLPDRLPEKPRFAWSKRLNGPALAGIAAAADRLIVADRDPLDQQDIFLCLKTATGEPLWQVRYPAPGNLDYGNSPRATPLIHAGKVYLLGAFGDLHCVDLSDGKVLWRKNLLRDFEAELPKWGYCWSPIVVDGKLIILPGARQASIVALDCDSGKTLWCSPGGPAAYASPIVARLGGRLQVVAYDQTSAGGWDLQTGRRLWTLVPPEKNDFNVPTPIGVDGKLLLCSENNGSRLYCFDSQGSIVPKPEASFADLAPDSSTPVATAGRVFGACGGRLYCLDLAKGLQPLWTADDQLLDNYVSFIASANRVLITTQCGHLLLVDATGPQYKLLSRLALFDGQTEVISHPAIVGNRLFVRDSAGVHCLVLE